VLINFVDTSTSGYNYTIVAEVVKFYEYEDNPLDATKAGIN
jgi:hypothetical protein